MLRESRKPGGSEILRRSTGKGAGWLVHTIPIGGAV
jgi:hypothetical protein